MKILLTNDDGIESTGLWALYRGLEKDHEVWVVAPDGNRSGTSNSITLGGPVSLNSRKERVYSCGGTPADCVLYSYLGAIPVKPDIVVSGINLGPNLGTDIIYSGTAAAARQAALMGYPGFALSLAETKPPFNFEGVVDFFVNNLGRLTELWGVDHFLNINAPNNAEKHVSARLTHPARRIYRDSLAHFSAPNGTQYYFLHGSLAEAELSEGSDWKVVKDGGISVSPVYLHPFNHSEDEEYRNADFLSVQ